MHILTKVLIISSICLGYSLPTPAKADLVDWGMVGGEIYEDDSFTSLVADGTTARLGTFGTGYSFSGKSFSQLNSDFITWGTDTSMLNGQFTVSNTTTTGVDGTPWYYFIGTSSTAFGIFGNAAWVNSGDPFVQVTDLTDPGTFAAGGFGSISGSNVALVPEPSTGLLIGAGSVVFLLLRRRRKVV
jgi:hypothetical protein